MSFTSHPQVNDVINALLSNLQMILGDQLAGLYLFGSLTTGDFDISMSDIDLLVAITQDLDQATFEALDHMHGHVTTQYPVWEGRIELAYVTQDALQTFRTKPYKIGIISPGEPFHMIDSSDGWLMNWYLAREFGKTLYGKANTDMITPIATSEYLANVRYHTLQWREWVKDAKDKPFLSYTVLTCCRGLYTLVHGQPASKVKSTDWAKTAYPQWSTLIDHALKWRHDPTIDALTPEEIRPQVEAFIEFVIANLPE